MGLSGRGGDFTIFNADVIPFPDSLIGNGDLTLAIRVSLRRLQSLDVAIGGLGLNCFIRIGNSADMRRSHSLFHFQAFTSNTLNLLLKVLLGILALVLAMALRRDREYLALLVFAGLSAFLAGFHLWEAFHNIPDSLPKVIFTNLLDLVDTVALIEFIRLVLKLTRSRPLVAYVILLVFVILLNDALLWHWVFFGDGSHYPAFARTVSRIVKIPYDYCLPFLALWIAIRQRNRDAFLLFFPLLLNSAYAMYFTLRALLIHFHGPVLDIPMNWIPGLYFQPDEVTTFLYTVTLLVFVVLRTVSIAEARARIAGELEAARAMQRLLLSGSSELTPGFEVETVYLPAGEVGGDFFLVSPGPDGTLTAIVGDVSGKGLAAAMRVSMILGVLRREDSRDPGTILARLNEALLAQSDAGFTTACCVRLDHDGYYTVANAGHISPYVGGSEIETLPAFPLGLAGAQAYGSVEGRLKAGERLVLISDGIVEARSPKGELFGFERVAVLSAKRAQEIADTAMQFGQDDDITVLTIACA